MHELSDKGHIIARLQYLDKKLSTAPNNPARFDHEGHIIIYDQMLTAIEKHEILKAIGEWSFNKESINRANLEKERLHLEKQLKTLL